MRPLPLRFALAATLTVALVAPAAAQPAAVKSVVAPTAVVSAANPLAAEAGLKVLREGGGAADAAVAIQAVLGLVEPQSSGLGGGAFLVYYDAQTRTVTAFDGRETAPRAARPDMFLGPDGRPLPFGQAVLSGRATGVPGAVAMLDAVHRAHGRKPWRSLFDDPIRLAAEGFTVSGRLARFINGAGGQTRSPDATAYFTKPDGARYQLGDTLKNPAYADTLRRLSLEGPAALLRGPTAERIVARTQAEPLPGSMTLEDLAGYQPRVSEALCRPYRTWRICTPQLPSGGAAVLGIMGLLAHTDIDDRGPADPAGWLRFAEASRLAYADRDYYLADPAFTPVPLEGLLDAAYLAERAKAIGDRAAPTVARGRPAGAQARGEDKTLEPAGTSSFAVVDSEGDVVAMTTTVESVFGTGRMVDGFFLNNELTDFSLAPAAPDGTPAANAVAGGKRPRSSMAPVIVLDQDGGFVAAVGSPGGTSIIAYVAKTLVGVLDWELPIDRAIALPNLIARGGEAGVEGSFDPAVGAALTARGLKLAPGRGEESGLHGVAKVPGGYQAAADPRREGVALGF